MGEHAFVCQAVKAVFRQRPPLPKYKSTFDITPVLSYIEGLEPLTLLSLKLLTFKTFFSDELLFSVQGKLSVSDGARYGGGQSEYQ